MSKVVRFKVAHDASRELIAEGVKVAVGSGTLLTGPDVFKSIDEPDILIVRVEFEQADA